MQVPAATQAERAQVHLEVGRRLLSGASTDHIGERIFDIVNQFDRGAQLITSRAERERVAELNLFAGKRAKTSTAYGSASAYFAAGMAMLDAMYWDSRHELMFALWLERAICASLDGQFDTAE